MQHTKNQHRNSDEIVITSQHLDRAFESMYNANVLDGMTIEKYEAMSYEDKCNYGNEYMRSFEHHFKRVNGFDYGEGKLSDDVIHTMHEFSKSRIEQDVMKSDTISKKLFDTVIDLVVDKVSKDTVRAIAEMITPKKIIYSPPKTVVIWKDDTKTIVSCGNGEKFDEYTGYCVAVLKKITGSTSRVKKIINEFVERPTERPMED